MVYLRCYAIHLRAHRAAGAAAAAFAAISPVQADDDDDAESSAVCTLHVANQQATVVEYPRVREEVHLVL